MTWKVYSVTNVMFYLDNMLGAGLIGDGIVSLPSYVCMDKTTDGYLLTICVSFVVWLCTLTAFV